MICFSVMQDFVKFFLCLALDGMPLCETRGQLSLVKGSQNMRPVGEEKGITDIEENRFHCRHGFHLDTRRRKMAIRNSMPPTRTTPPSRHVRSSQTQFDKPCTPVKLGREGTTSVVPLQLQY